MRPEIEVLIKRDLEAEHTERVEDDVAQLLAFMGVTSIVEREKTEG